MKTRKQEIANILVQIDNYTSEMMQDATFTLHGKLVEETPVDTSYASNKWWFAVGKLPRRSTGSVSLPAAEAGVARTQQAVFTYDLSQGSMFVYNDTTYIEYLNKGSSRQAPAMFVEKETADTVREINSKYNRKVLEL